MSGMPAAPPDRGSPPTPPPDNDRYGVAYYRVSTSRQANTSFDEDGFSIQAQREYCQRKAAELHVQLVDEYIDRGKSARNADRPALQAMLARLKADTDIQYVFVHKLDRLARNRQDDVQIGLLLAKNGVHLVSCTENIDDTPSGKLVRGIMGDIAEWYSANLSEEAKKGMRKKAELGGTPGKAPLGYSNSRLKITELGKDIGTVQVDPTDGPLITECFKLYDSGQCTLSDVAAYANDHGLCLPATKRLPARPLRRQNMMRILRNRYYTGRLSFNGVEYAGQHPRLIDDGTFARVQALLTARNLSKDKRNKRPHHLKGVLYCARCGHRFGITVVAKPRSGAHYTYFYCLGRQVNRSQCPQAHLPVSEVEAAVRDYWSHLRLPTERIQALRSSILATFADKQDIGQAKIVHHRNRVRALQQRLKKAKAAYYADALPLAEFKVEQDTIRHGIQSAEAAIAQWSVELTSLTSALDEALRLVADPQALYDALPDHLKMLLVQTVFTKIWLLDTSVVGSDLTEPYFELLTLDARLALERATNQPLPADGEAERTHYRQRETPQPAWEWSSASLFIERPVGRLPINRSRQSKNRGQQGDHGSNMMHLVRVMGLKLNSELVDFMHTHPLKSARKEQVEQSKMYRRSQRRLRDRLTEKDMVRLVMAYETGITMKALAERYGINAKSVRKLLQEEEASRSCLHLPRANWQKVSKPPT